MKPILGILGGMGPEAGVDFALKLTKATKAHIDQEHIPFLLYSACDIPDRTTHIMRGGYDPFPELLASIKLLEASGVEYAVIPCNTAHYWFDKLQNHTSIKLISIIDVAIGYLKDHNITEIAIMANKATITHNLYQEKLAIAGITATVPDEAHQDRLVEGIFNLKGQRFHLAHEQMHETYYHLKERGAKHILMACTEIPIGLRDIKDHLLLDATDILAKKCVKIIKKKQLSQES